MLLVEVVTFTLTSLLPFSLLLVALISSVLLSSVKLFISFSSNSTTDFFTSKSSILLAVAFTITISESSPCSFFKSSIILSTTFTSSSVAFTSSAFTPLVVAYLPSPNSCCHLSFLNGKVLGAVLVAILTLFLSFHFMFTLITFVSPRLFLTNTLAVFAR